jgi:hypothetical protein
VVGVTSPPRRRDSQPVGRPGELALLGLAGGLMLIVGAALVGLGAASFLFGGGWVWPPGGSMLNHTLGGMVTGHPGRGLPPRLAARVPSPGVVYAVVATAEVLLLATGILVARRLASYPRPGDARAGMASRADAAAALGVRQLRRARAIIRPDLYGTKRDQDRADTGGGDR